MDLGFRGEVTEFYHSFRRGYPPSVIDSVVNEFGLTGDDLVVDLGCGTGQLTVPLANRVRAVVAVDPEPDMLARGRRAASERGAANIGWMIGADTDMRLLGSVLGGRRAGAVTIAQALHWMHCDELFPALAGLLRPGGGVAVITNGTPLWLQDTDWSRALRGYLEQWSGSDPADACGTDEVSQLRYRDGLAAAGFGVRESSVEYSGELDLEQIIGSLYSAMHEGQLPPPDERPRFADQVRRALAPRTRFTEHVCVRMLLGRIG